MYNPKKFTKKECEKYIKMIGESDNVIQCCVYGIGMVTYTKKQLLDILNN